MIRRLALALVLLSLCITPVGAATIYYIGAFTTCAGGACPGAVDDGTCGAVHPCATLAWFNSPTGRGAPQVSGDTVRLFGDLTSCGTNCAYNCIKYRTGITWEGRNADDTAVNTAGCGARVGNFSCNYSKAIIHAELTTVGGICNVSGGAAGIVANQITADNGIVRDMTINGGQASRVFPTASTHIANPTIVRVKFTGQANAGGLIVGDTTGSDPACTIVPRSTTTNITIDDNEFTNGGDNNGGLQIGCVSGGEIKRNWPHGLAADGIHMGGLAGTGLTLAEYAVVADNVIENNGGDGIDISGNSGDTVEAGCHEIIFERNEMHDNATTPSGTGNCAMNHGAYNIIARNNVGWGASPMFHFKECPDRIFLLNNTCFANGPCVRGVTIVRDLDMENNLWSGGGTGQNGAVIVFRDAMMNPSWKWKNNVIVNRNGGFALGQSTDIGAPGVGCNCDPVKGTNCVAPTGHCGDYTGFTCTAARPCSWCQGGSNAGALCCIAGSGCDADYINACGGGGTCTCGESTTRTTYNNYSAFTTLCTNQVPLSPTPCTGASWGTSPLFSLGVPTAPFAPVEFVLATGDTIAQDQGVNLAPLVTVDYFGTPRPQGAAYDVGFDETFTGTSVTVTTVTTSTTTTTTSTTTTTLGVSTSGGIYR